MGGIRFIEEPRCGICGCPVDEGALCEHCANSQHSVDRIITVTDFSDLIQEMIHRFKYNQCTALAEPLVGLMFRYWVQHPLQVDCIIPVPLHPRRLQERGYNQAALLAEGLGERLGIPVLLDVLVRIKYTKPQVGLTAEERKENVRGAFACPHKALIGKSVLLVDDVCTTGATLEACSVALKTAGATRVLGFTLARPMLGP